MTSKVYVALRVPTDPMRAFEAFTQEIGEWWRPGELFRITPRGDGVLAFEPGPQGRLVTRLPNGVVFEIGRISVWEPGARLVFSWLQAGFLPGQATEVEVRFEAVGEETRVSIEHRAWDAIPQDHVARHGFPLEITLARAADWWRGSLNRLRARLAEPAPRATDVADATGRPPTSRTP